MAHKLAMQIFRFCHSKCHENFKMKRNPRKVKWTKSYRRLHDKYMTQDSTFEFERECNRPERYDKNVTDNTLKDIKKTDKVRLDREARHGHAKRMKGKKAQLQREAAKELEQSIHKSHVKAPAVLQQDPWLTLPKMKVQVSQRKLRTSTWRNNRIMMPACSPDDDGIDKKEFVNQNRKIRLTTLKVKLFSYKTKHKATQF